MTYATLKRLVANTIGRTDNTTANTIRDNAINDAITQIVNEYKFSWLMKKGTGTIASNEMDLASDYNASHGLETVYSPATGEGNDDIYVAVGMQEKDNYSSSDYIYWLTWDSTSEVHVLNSNQSADAIEYYYYFTPAELSADTDVCIVPDPQAVVYLAVSKWWLGKERDEDNSDRFYTKYEARMQKMIQNDQKNNTKRRALKSMIPGEYNQNDILMCRRP